VRRSPDPPSAPTRILVVADAAAPIVFVLAGIRSHHEVGALELIARNVIPLGIAWFAVGAVVGVYRRPGLRSLRVTWIVAVPTGVAARSLWVGSPTGGELLLFVVVASAFTLFFLLVGRWISGVIARRLMPVGPDAWFDGPYE
jgi:TRAP-type uncharacterized transport system fused permease subunit